MPPNLLPEIDGENPSWHIETDADMSSFEDNKNVARRARRRRAADTHTLFFALSAEERSDCECVCVESLWMYTQWNLPT